MQSTSKCRLSTFSAICVTSLNQTHRSFFVTASDSLNIFIKFLIANFVGILVVWNTQLTTQLNVRHKCSNNFPWWSTSPLTTATWRYLTTKLSWIKNNLACWTCVFICCTWIDLHWIVIASQLSLIKRLLVGSGEYWLLYGTVL